MNMNIYLYLIWDINKWIAILRKIITQNDVAHMINDLKYTDILGSLWGINEKAMQSINCLKIYYVLSFYFLKDMK